MLFYPWHVQMLGGFQVKHGNRVAPRFRTGKTAALLAYLAYHPTQSPTREQLLFLLWPEVSEAQGRVSLRSALASVRRQLEPPGTPDDALFLLKGDTIQINSASVTMDVGEFEHAWQKAIVAPPAAKIAALTHAVETYTGELLPGHYEEWVHPERCRLDIMYQNVLLQLIQALEADADWDHAMLYAQRAVRHDALSQEAHHALMRLYAATGQTSLALRQYRHCKQLLHQEGSAELAETMQALARQLRRKSTPSTLTVVSDPPKTRPSTPQPAASPPLTRHCTPSVSTLPLVFTPFFGREDELRDLQRLTAPPPITALKEAKALNGWFPPCLITLTGPGGTGKTRLALEAARRLSVSYEDAVWFVSLTDVTESRQVIQRIHEVLRLPRAAEAAVWDQIVGRLTQQPCLLVLDNFEQLLDEDYGENSPLPEGVAVVQKLLENVPGIRCLVTSRRRLGLHGEQEIFVAPLPIPHLLDTPQTLMTFASVQLFVQRAQLRRVDFAVNARNSHAIAALCTRLEGIPLALELAAARALTHTPTQMLKELDRRFDFLVSRHRNVVERHQTLRATIDWSYERLTPDLQLFFARLSVFRGSWTAEAAQGVIGTKETVSTLERLCEHSLVMAIESDKTVRFRMLETLREFADDHLTMQERELMRERHAHYYLHFLEEQNLAFHDVRQAEWTERVEAEYSNIQVALTWSVTECHSPEIALCLTRALCRYWQMRGRGQEGQKWLEAALACKSSHLSIYAATLEEAARFYTELGMNEQVLSAAREGLRCYEAAQDLQGQARMMGYMGYSSSLLIEERICLLQKSLAIADSLGDVAGRATALDHLGRTGFPGHSVTQRLAWLEESQLLYRQLGNMRKAAILSGEIGFVLYNQNEFQRAKAQFEDFLAVSREMDDPRNMAHASWQLGNVALLEGSYAEAETLYAQAVQCLCAIENREGQAYALYLYSLGAARVWQQRFAEGKADLEEGLRHFELAHLPQGVACVQERLGTVALWQNEREAARRLLGTALKTFCELRNEHGIAPALLSLARLECQEKNLAAAKLHAIESLRLRHRLDSRLGQVQCLEVLAQIAVIEGNEVQAAHLLSVAGTHRQQMNTPLAPFEQQGVEQALHQCKKVLSQFVWEHCCKESENALLTEIVMGVISSNLF